MAIGVVLVHEQTLVRETLRRVLEQDAAIRVVGEAESVTAAVGLIGRVRPAVAILHMDAPGRSFVEAPAAIAHACERTAVVVLSSRPDAACVSAALQSGAAGLVTVHDRAASLAEAVREVAKGERHLSPEARARLRAWEASPRLFPQAAGVDLLTAREREVLVQLGRGLSVKEAARLLSVAPKTVDNHAQRLMAKLDIHSRAELVHFAIREKLIPA